MKSIVLNLSLLNADKLQTSLRRWSIADVLDYNLDGIGGLPQHTKAILHTSVSRGATPTSVRGFPHRRAVDRSVHVSNMKARRADMVLQGHVAARRLAEHHHPGAFVGRWLETTAASRECAGASALHGWDPPVAGMFGVVCPNGIC